LILVPVLLGAAGPGWPVEAGWQLGWFLVGVAASRQPLPGRRLRMAGVNGQGASHEVDTGGIALSESFGMLLRRVRGAAGLTQEELAERAQLTDRGIRYLERGLRRPNRDTVQRLARALELGADGKAAFAAAARAHQPEVFVSRGELRLPPYPLVGREHDITRVRDHLVRHEGRLLTLTGPGGVGKTSLALVAAAGVRAAFPGGVTWVSLASLADPALLSTAVAHGLGLMDTGSGHAVASIHAALDERPTLMVLDNLEHLAAGRFLSDLLATCPQLTVLATSRSPLGIRAEREFPVRPLPTPRDVPGLPVHAVAASPSVDLFLRRAQAVQPPCVLTETNAPAIAEICRRLDGLPLAIELAAARIRVLSPPAMLARLDRRLSFLTGGGGDLPTRQTSMRSTLAWSYDLLSPAHQEVFARSAVFDGSFGLTALEAVLQTDPMTLLDAVESLHRSNLLVLADSADDEPRFRMLGTIRDFGLECLARQGDAEELRARHATYYLVLAEEAAPGLYGPEATRVLDLLEDDHANLRAALRRYLDQGNVVPGLRLCAALWMFWYVRGHATEGRAHIAAFLAPPTPASTLAERARAEALLGAGQLAQTQGDYAAAARSLEMSIQLYRSMGDEHSTSAALLAAGFTARVQENYPAARQLLQQSLTLARNTGHEFVTAAALHHLGMIAADAHHDLPAAQHLLDESLTFYRSIGAERFIALLQLSLGDVARGQRHFARAQLLLTQGLTGLTQVGERLGIHGALDSLARVAADQRRWDRAVMLAAAAERLRRSTGSRSWPVVERHRNQWLAHAHQNLTEPDFSSAWTRGEAMTPEQAVSYALQQEELHPNPDQEHP
jgi:predicted ATPase/DNA-binding XRE family transcriptional regulator